MNSEFIDKLQTLVARHFPGRYASDLSFLLTNGSEYSVKNLPPPKPAKTITPRWSKESVDRMVAIATEHDKLNCFVYFVQEASKGSIKIGSSLNPKSRINSMQTGCPYKLEILGIIKGNRDREMKLHERFSDYRLTGEWFSKDILNDIKVLLYSEGVQEQKV